jgi:hypothetical protein
LPELEIPRRFRWTHLQHYAEIVRSPGRRTLLTRNIARVRATSARG